jgi:transcriptional regulator with XRE-family HTH domain
MTNELDMPLEYIAAGLLKAREFRGLSQKETADLLGISTAAIKSFENGKNLPSLPALESLAYIYQIPLDVLASPDKLEDFTYQPNSEQLQQLLKVRRNIISTSLQIALDNREMSQKELSAQTGVSRSKIKRYLDGDDIPLDALKKISDALSIDQKQLIDSESQIGFWQAKQKAFEKFSQMPEAMVEFLSKSENLDFISLAEVLSSLDLAELDNLSNAFNQLRGLLQKNQ